MSNPTCHFVIFQVSVHILSFFIGINLLRILASTLLLSLSISALGSEDLSQIEQKEKEELKLEISQKSTLNVYEMVKLLKEKNETEYQKRRLKIQPLKSL